MLRSKTFKNQPTIIFEKIIPRVAFQKIERKRNRKRKHHLRLRCKLRLRLVNFVTKGGPYEFLNQFKKSENFHRKSIAFEKIERKRKHHLRLVQTQTQSGV